MSTQTRKPKSQRKEEIVLAVLRIIGEQGLTSLSTTTLAREVGVTTGALFRHFATLDAILAAVVEHAISRINETFPDEDLPPIERILELATNRVRLFGGNPGLAWLLRSEQAYLNMPKDSAAKLRDVVRRSKRFMLKALQDGSQRGEIRDDIEPEILLVPLMGTIHALIGMPGVHRTRRRPETGRILSALMEMLAPPHSLPARNRKSQHNRRRK